MSWINLTQHPIPVDYTGPIRRTIFRRPKPGCWMKQLLKQMLRIGRK